MITIGGVGVGLTIGVGVGVGAGLMILSKLVMTAVARPPITVIMATIIAVLGLSLVPGLLSDMDFHWAQ